MSLSQYLNNSYSSASTNVLWHDLVTYSGDLKSDHLKSGNIWNPDFLKVGFQMVRFSNGRALAINHSKSGRFCPDFKWFLTKWRPFVRISNGWASGFQIPFEIQTICNPTCFGPFEIQTRSDFRSPLYTAQSNSILSKNSPWVVINKLLLLPHFFH